MRSLFDVNVLIALLDSGHVHHDAAHRWWEANRAHGWATCPLTQNGFVGIMTQPSYPVRLSPVEALTRLRHETSRVDHQFWPDDISILDADIFDYRRILGPNQITDHYLLGLAVNNKGRFVTFDTAVSIASVPAASNDHLVSLAWGH